MFKVEVLTTWNSEQGGNILQVILDHPAEWTEVTGQDTPYHGLPCIAQGRVSAALLDEIHKGGVHTVLSSEEIEEDFVVIDPDKPVEEVPADIIRIDTKEPLDEEKKRELDVKLSQLGIDLLLRTDESHEANIKSIKEILRELAKSDTPLEPEPIIKGSK